MRVQLVIAFAATRAGRDRAESAVVLEEGSAKIRAVGEWAGLTQVNAVRALAVLMTSDPAIENGFKGEIAATSAKIGEIQKKVEAMNLTVADKAQMEKIAASRKVVLDLRAKANQLKADKKSDELAALMSSQYRPALVTYEQSQRDFVKMQEDAFEVSRLYYVGRSKELVTISSIVAALVIAGILFGAAALIRSLRAPLLKANALAARIAQGDLSEQIDESRQDEFGDLMKSLAAMNQSLGSMVSQIRMSTDSIALASAESPLATTTSPSAPSRPPATCRPRPRAPTS